MNPIRDQFVREPGRDRLPTSLCTAEFDPVDALGALDAGVAAVGSDWHIAFANQTWGRLLDVRIADVVGQDLRTAVPALAGSREEPLIRMTLRDGVPRAFRLDRRRRGGTGVFQVRVTRSGRGMILLTLHDIEESESLRDLARQMAEVADTHALLNVLCHAALRHCDADGVAAIRVTGEEAEVVTAAGCVANVSGLRFALAGSLADRALAEGHTILEPEYATHYPQFGSYADTAGVGSVMLAPLIAQDQPLGALFVARAPESPLFGPTDENRLQVIADHASLALWKSRLIDEARAASEAKGNFLATMSHELRTPLTALTGYGELLADEIIGPLSRGQHDIVERMRSVTHHLTVMIDEILSFSSIEAGRETVRPVEVDGGAIVHAAMAVVEPLARQKGIQIEDRVEPGPHLLRTDPDKVRQILVNLAGNAIKFTDHGHVELGLVPDGDRLRFTVHDTGVGISREDLARLFQPFTQIETGLTRRHGGTGLGLYISRRLAELLGGTIEVSSERGAGSLFSLVVPVEYAPPVTGEAEALATAGAPTRPPG